MDTLKNSSLMAQNLAKALHASKQKYDDEKIVEVNDLLLDNEEENLDIPLSEFDMAVQNVIFGLKGIGNFTNNKEQAEQHLYNFLTSFSSNYVVNNEDLPTGTTSETKIVFIVRYIEALLTLLTFDLNEKQNELVLTLIQYGLNTIIEIANNL